MYCDEKIINVYLGQPDYNDNGELFLDCYCDMALHMTPNFRLIFETNSLYISVQTDGVHKTNKTGEVGSIEKENEWIESCYCIDEDPEYAPSVDYEFTLFSGEQIVEIKPCDKGYIIQFSDFELRVVPYTQNEEVFFFYPAAYSKVLGAERLIHKCSCGGTGILVIDFVHDYGIRCDRCHKGTSAAMCAIYAIEEWNEASDSLYQIGDYPAESFQKYCYGKIEYIAIEERYHEYDNNLLACSSVVIKIDDKLFDISSCYAGKGTYGFEFKEISDFNRNVWPRKIVSTIQEPIKFIRKEVGNNAYSVLRFEIGNRPLLITANKLVLTVELSHWDSNGNWIEYDNNILPNEKW